MPFLVIVLVAFAPGIFWMWMVRRRDRNRPEPRGLVVRTFVLGASIAVPVALVEFLLVFIVDPEALGTAGTGQLSLGTMAYMAFVVAGVTEEAAKYFVVRRIVYNSPYFDEPMDGLVYAAAAALGFASLENLAYAVAFGWDVILLRGVFSTLAHVLFSVLWGYPLAMRKVGRCSSGIVWLGLAGAMAAHGLFDFLLFGENLLSLLAIPLFLIAGVFFIFLLRRARKLSPFADLVAPALVTCPRCGARVPVYGGFCTACGADLSGAEANGAVHCGRCGAELSADSEFCTACGSRLTHQPPD